MKVIVGAYSDIGISRENNQDALCVLQAETKGQNICMAIVCDGMGGLSKGEVASSVVIQEFTGWFEEDFPCMLNRATKEQIIDIWKTKLWDLSEQLKNYGNKHNILCGTTFSGILILGEEFLWVHVGDSRIYHMGRRFMEQITTDHTVIARELKKGTMTLAEAQHSNQKGKLTQCIGASQMLEPESGIGKIKKGEIILLCTDGFYHKFSEEEIAQVYQMRSDNELGLERYCMEQTKEAMRRMEKDNISVVVIKAD